VVLILHIVVIYAINAILKVRSDAWMAGVGAQRIMQLEDFVYLLGPAIAEIPALLTAINWLWTATLAASVLLVLATGRPRTATVAAFVGAHLGMAATMRLGAFPFVMIAALLVFLPPQVWDRVDRYASATGVGRRLESVVTRGRTERGVVREKNAETGPASSGPVTAPGLRHSVRRTASVVLVCVFVAVVGWQVVAAGLVDSPISDGGGTLEGASWAFFAPDPPTSYSWYVVEATAESGASTDLVTGGPVTFDRPPNAMDRYPSTLWKRYGTKAQDAGAPVLESAGAYFCDRAPEGVESVTVYRVEQPVDADGPVGEPIPHERVSHAC
jgi:hypothetical protein